MEAATEQIGIDVLFDTKGATQQSKNLTKSFTDMDKANKDSSKSGMLAMSAAVAIGNIMTQGFNKLMSKMGAAIPALGETISQAGTVIFNNLFKPLSDVLMPLLVKLMNWVRDNRTGFVQLGSVISGAFKFLFEIVSQVFGVISRITNKFFSAITGGTKMSFKSVADFMNLLLLKIAFVIQFVFLLIEPVIDMLADIIIWLGKSVVKPFFDGFIEGAMEMFGPIDGLIDAFKDFWDSLKIIGSWFDGEGSIIKDFFKFLGKIAGAVLVAPLRMAKEAVILLLKAFAGLVKGIDFLIKGAKNIGPAIMGGLTSAGSTIRTFFSEVVDWAINKFMSIVDWFKALPGRIASAVNYGMDIASKAIDEKIQSIKSFFGFGKSEPAATATGAAVNNNTANNSKQQNNYTLTVNGSQDVAADGKKLIEQAQSKSSIQNQQAARGVR